jgi:hypothetical protein
MYYPGDKQKQAHEVFYAQALAASSNLFLLHAKGIIQALPYPGQERNPAN